MKTIILAEKPQASEKMEEALGVKAVPARGHLLMLANKDRVWKPPYFDITWKPRKALKSQLDSIVSQLADSDQIYVGTDYDYEGQLIALNIMRHGEISPEDAKRMKFSSLENEELRKAYDNPIAFDVNLALAAETRHFLDWYFGMNISKVLTTFFRKHGIRKGLKALTPSGRVQSPTLAYLVEREEEISGHSTRTVWYIDVYGTYGEYSDRFFEITRKWYDRKEGAELFTRHTTGKVAEVYESVYEVEYFPPNKDYVMKEALDLGISANLVDAVLQDLYLDEYISYPRTGSRQYLAHGVDTQKYLKRLVEVIPEAEQALGNAPREGEETDVHPAIYPIRPYHEMDLRGTIWRIIADSFVKCHRPPEEHKYPRMTVRIGDEELIAFDYVEELDEGDEFDLTFKIGEGRTAPPPRHDQAKVYDWMMKEGMGTRDTRSQILSRLLNSYVYETDDGLYVTSKGIKIVNVLKSFAPDLIDVDLTRRFESYVESVKSGSPPEKILEEGKEAVTEIVNVLYKHEDDLVKLLR